MRVPAAAFAACLLAAPGRLTAQPAAPPAAQPIRPAAAALDSARHALNRLGYGPLPGQIEAVAREGVARWIERQLAPRPPEDTALRERERAFPILSRSPNELASEFARPLAQRARPLPDSAPAADSMETRREMARGLRARAGQLQQLVIVRAVHAEHQLQEVMADFWINHFNVFYGKGLDRVYLPEYVERTIRPRALGRFEDLLLATARSPAMLVYLDNAQSVAPGAELPQLPSRALGRRLGRSGVGPLPALSDSMRRALEARRPRGLNENYARELLELHTLGVDGGYTQDDVVNVARILTGWSVSRRRGGFTFNAWAHDRDQKTVLGEPFLAGQGESEGVRLIGLLARHPATLHHVSRKLCARFVSDAPPDGCIDDAVRAWRGSDGDVREVLRAIFYSPDFWAPEHQGAKLKTPLEFVVSALRAVAAEPDPTPRVALAVARLGQPLYLQSAPTGYPEAQEDWVSSGALLARMNLAIGLAAGRLPGATLHLDRVLPHGLEGEALVDALDRAILGGVLGEHTRRVIAREIGDLPDSIARRALALGLALGSPEFQRQ
jgi:uncharacterized protein (DUF1800 family)